MFIAFAFFFNKVKNESYQVEQKNDEICDKIKFKILIFIKNSPRQGKDE